jgi:thiol-disulfide isomerase/thioredoxin
MANSKHQPTAAQRREEARSQRQQRLAPAAAKQAQSRNNNRRKRYIRKGLPWGLIVGVLLALAAVIALFIYLASVNNTRSSTTGGNSSDGMPAPASVLGPVTHVSPAILAEVGTGGQKDFLVPTGKAGSPPLVGPTGKPEFFYFGAEYCPYCAAERWGVVVALSRFGSFANLHLTTSSSTDVYPNTPTFTFYKSSYSSKYVDFVSVESEGRTQGQPLQTPTADQLRLFNTFDGPPYFSSAGSIPFINIANRYLAQGASYDPGVLRTNPQDPGSAPLSQQDVANALANPNSKITQGIVGTANYLTAAICQSTNQQPASVCSQAPVPPIQHVLGQTANGPASAAAGLAFAPLDVPARLRSSLS